MSRIFYNEESEDDSDDESGKNTYFSGRLGRKLQCKSDYDVYYDRYRDKNESDSESEKDDDFDHNTYGENCDICDKPFVIPKELYSGPSIYYENFCKKNICVCAIALAVAPLIY